MDNSKLIIIGNTLFNVAMVAGIVYLASQGKDGWGWLIFLLVIKND